MNASFLGNPRFVVKEKAHSAQRLSMLEDRCLRPQRTTHFKRWRRITRALLRARQDFRLMQEIASEAFLVA